MIIHKCTGFCCELLLSVKKHLDQTQHLNAVSSRLQSESLFFLRFSLNRSQFCTVGLLWCRGSRYTLQTQKSLQPLSFRRDGF